VRCRCAHGCKETILARRKAHQVRTLVARRERYRRTGESSENAGQGHPECTLTHPVVSRNSSARSRSTREC